MNQLKLGAMSLALLAAWPASSQTKIGSTTGPGDASAVLELQSNNQGFLHPRLTTTQRDAIVSPAVGLTIYNTTANCLQMYKGAGNGGWYDLCSTSTPSTGSVAFTNCGTPVITGTFKIGQATTATVTLNYTNSSGQTNGIFASSTVSGVTFSAPGGSVTSLTAGSGSIVLTASGTPTTSGTINIPVVLAGAGCAIPITVAACSDPTSTVGSTGCVAFNYMGNPVVYTTVRAKDNKIWLQQNVGSTKVAATAGDAAGFGDFFQWGRWDDGHQLPTSTVVTSGLPSPNNPSGIGTGTTNFYSPWWNAGATSNTWSGSTASSATAGKDPCVALGSGWHMPTSAEWQSVLTAEPITNHLTGYSSNLKLPYQSGYRLHTDGSVQSRNSSTTSGWYWTGSTATATRAEAANSVSIVSGSATISTNNDRGFGFEIRCIK